MYLTKALEKLKIKDNMSLTKLREDLKKEIDIFFNEQRISQLGKAISEGTIKCFILSQKGFLESILYDTDRVEEFSSKEIPKSLIVNNSFLLNFIEVKSPNGQTYYYNKRYIFDTVTKESYQEDKDRNILAFKPKSKDSFTTWIFTSYLTEDIQITNTLIQMRELNPIRFNTWENNNG